MRASINKAHVSGAERLVDGWPLDRVLAELICRALSSHVMPDEICVTADPVDPASISYTKSLDVRTIDPSSHKEAYKISTKILRSSGVSAIAIERAFRLLLSGPSPDGNNMRGAIIMNALTGDRIEPDMRRGVRVSRIDYTGDARALLERGLKGHGVYHERVIDALAIATKVSDRDETLAELCWSDNPRYTTGYVASTASGYVRIMHMKENGALKGGRVFFVDYKSASIDQYIDYLERQPVIIDEIGHICGSENIRRRVKGIEACTPSTDAQKGRF